MSCKVKIMSNVKKCINESKSDNTNIDFNVKQVAITLVAITSVDFDTFLKNL